MTLLKVGVWTWSLWVCHSPPPVLLEDAQLQLHSTLTEGFSSVVHFLQSVSDQQQQRQQQQQQQQVIDSEVFHSPLILAAVRVLGAWLAEESLALSAEVYSLLPFLVTLCREEEEVVRFLMPGFSHLLAEERPRDVLISAGLSRVLVRHFKGLQEVAL